MSATSNKLASVAPIQQGGPTMTLNYTLEVIMSAPTNKLASVALTCLESGRATLLETVDPRHRKMALHQAAVLGNGEKAGVAVPQSQQLISFSFTFQWMSN